MTMKLLLRSNFSLFLIFLFLLSSCEKEDAFKNPTPVIFNFGMNQQGVGGSDDLTFSDGYIIIHQFSVIGERVEGEDFEFLRTFPNGLKIPFYNNSTFDELSFDLPQGAYNSLKIRFETQSGINTNLFVKGRYLYNNPLKNPSTVHLKWNTNKVFEANVLSSTGMRSLVLNETKTETPRIIFKPKPWFADVTEMMLENASFLTTANNEQIMTIDPTNNVTIFTEIDLKIGTELKCSL